MNVLCNGESNGAIFLQLSGGSPPYNFVWSNGATTQDLIGITAGSYSVTISDTSLCSIQLTNVIINEPSMLSVLLDTLAQNTCFGDTAGYIGLAVAGSVSPYFYQWSTGATTDFIDSLASGFYAVTVSDSQGCLVLLDSISIDTITEVQPIINAISNITCNLSNDGSIDIGVTGGIGGYTYQWSNGATTQDLSSLATGVYSLTILDANLCESIIGPISITQPDSLIVLDSVVHVTCFGDQDGEILLQVTGGTSPYSFLWSNGATTQQIQNLFSGVYAVTVTDSLGCSTTLTSMQVTQPSLLLVQTDTTAQNSCAGQGIGYILSLIHI